MGSSARCEDASWPKGTVEGIPASRRVNPSRDSGGAEGICGLAEGISGLAKGIPASRINPIWNSGLAEGIPTSRVNPILDSGTAKGIPASRVNPIFDSGTAVRDEGGIWPRITLGPASCPNSYPRSGGGVGIQGEDSGELKLSVMALWGDGEGDPISGVGVRGDSPIWLNAGWTAGIRKSILAHRVGCYPRVGVGVPIGVPFKDASGLKPIQVDIPARPPVIGIGGGLKLLPVGSCRVQRSGGLEHP